MLRKKIRKYICVFMAVFIACSSCLIASADSDLSDVNNNFGGFNVKYITVACYEKNTDNFVKIENVEVVASTGAVGDNDPGRGIALYVTCDRNLTNANDYTLTVALWMANDRYTNPDYKVSGSYLFGLDNEYWDMFQWDYESGFPGLGCYRYNVTNDDYGETRNYVQRGELTFPDTSYTQYAKSTFTQNALGDYYNLYTTTVIARPITSFNQFYIYLYDFNFFVFDPITHALENIGDTISESADKIIANQDENMDELLNGWTNENTLDGIPVRDYEAQQNEIIDSTAEGRDEMISIFNNFGSMFNPDGSLYKGVYVASKIFTNLFSVSWVASLVQFSLAIGIFSFLIGAVNIVVGKISSSRESRKDKSPRQTVHTHYHFSSKRKGK